MYVWFGSKWTYFKSKDDKYFMVKCRCFISYEHPDPKFQYKFPTEFQNWFSVYLIRRNFRADKFSRIFPHNLNLREIAQK